jgi:hypothetical protein
VSLWDIVDTALALILIGWAALAVVLAVIWTPIGIVYAGRSLWRRLR